MILVTGKKNSGKSTFIKMLKEYLPDTMILETQFPEGSDAFIIEIINRGSGGPEHDENIVNVQINNNSDLKSLKYKAQQTAKEYKRERPI